MHRRLLVPALASGTLVLCGAHPPPEGDEISADIGASAYELRTGGCGAPVYSHDVFEPALHVAATHREKWGGTVAVEGTIAPGVVVDRRLVEPGDDPDDPIGSPLSEGTVLLTANGAARLGWHWRYVGGEFGFMAIRNDYAEPIWPSGRAWVGYPRYLYLWGELLAGPTTGLLTQSVAAGVGVSHESVRFEAGLNFFGLEGSLAALARPGLWLGVDASTYLYDGVDAGPGFRGLVTLSIDPRALGR